MKRFIARSMVLILCALAISAVGAGQLFAQQSEKKARALVYNDGVPEGPDSTGTYLTRNSLDKVKAYYQDLKGKLDTVRAWEGERGMGSVGYTFTYKYTIEGGSPTEWASATVWRIDEEKYRKEIASQPGGALALETAQPLPLSQLKIVLQSGASGHTQAEYDGLVRKYRHLQFSFFRQVKNEKGELQPEDRVIYDRFSKQVYGDADAPAKKGGVDKAKKQRQKETAARIKELKKQGKTAEAMELAMQMQQEMMSEGEREQYMAMAPRATGKDAWNVWVRCLEDMSKAAYPVKIVAGSAMYPDLK